jgi:hypothetical protein
MPANPAANDTNAVEVGLRFTVGVPGLITAVRCYRAVSIPAGIRVSVWGADGALLGRGIAIEGQGPTPGWQTVQLATPAVVIPNTLYTASYFAPQGAYAFTSGGFTAALDTPPLRAPASVEVGGNGVYRYDAAGGLPTDSFQDADYGVDVIFTPTTQSVPAAGG